MVCKREGETHEPLNREKKNGTQELKLPKLYKLNAQMNSVKRRQEKRKQLTSMKPKKDLTIFLKKLRVAHSSQLRHHIPYNVTRRYRIKV